MFAAGLLLVQQASKNFNSVRNNDNDAAMGRVCQEPLTVDGSAIAGYLARKFWQQKSELGNTKLSIFTESRYSGGPYLEVRLKLL